MKLVGKKLGGKRFRKGERVRYISDPGWTGITMGYYRLGGLDHLLVKIDAVPSSVIDPSWYIGRSLYFSEIQWELIR
jgi:hypothetical protein